MEGSNLIVVGERHKKLEYAVKEAELIEAFNPQRVLLEMFVDAGMKEIKKHITSWTYSSSPPDRVRLYIPLFVALLKSQATYEGCDNRELTDRVDEYEVASRDVFKGLNYALEHSAKLRRCNRERERLMAAKIARASGSGKTLAIVGSAHLEGISLWLKKRDIEADLIDLENSEEYAEKLQMLRNESQMIQEFMLGASWPKS